MAQPWYQQALGEGARRSLVACSLPAGDPWPIGLWRRRRGWFIVLGLLLLEGLVLGKLGSTMAMKF